jgi:uncharacterized protein YmfQ (DUF2313 family)
VRTSGYQNRFGAHTRSSEQLGNLRRCIADAENFSTPDLFEGTGLQQAWLRPQPWVRHYWHVLFPRYVSYKFDALTDVQVLICINSLSRCAAKMQDWVGPLLDGMPARVQPCWAASTFDYSFVV